MSDASYLRGPDSGASSPGGRGYTNANGVKTMRFSMGNSVPMTQAAQLIRASSESASVAHQSDLHIQLEGLSVHDSMSASTSLPPMKPPPTQRAPSPGMHLSAFPEPPAATLAFRRQQAVSHDRAVSIVSMNTDSELCAIAELMSSSAENGEEPGEPELADPFEKFPLPTPEEVAALFDDSAASVEEDPRANRHSTSSSRPSSAKHTSLSGSVYADSEGGHSSAGYGESALLSPLSAAFPAYHLPRSAMLRNRDSDTPSLSSSISVLSTPSLSRPSSIQQLPYASPPVSPIITTPVDVIPTSPYGRNHLGVIQEVRTSEDLECPTQYQGDNFGSKTAYSEMSNGALQSPINAEYDGTQTGDDSQSDQKAYHAKNRPHSLAPSQDSSVSTRSDSPSWQSSDKSVQGGSALGRLFSKDRKRSSSGNVGMSQSHFSLSEVDLKAAKVEEKQRKKQDSKEKSERLAQELKDKEKARKNATEADRKSVSGRSKHNRWEERAVMYGGRFTSSSRLCTGLGIECSMVGSYVMYIDGRTGAGAQ
ncbi:hypothetical protein OBBRIDRAFT_298061 [Obba rivulosa]|uniref:Uncharacterized protein n=1 Tax=Obba rivulosa TaxID=1052685 RepID=A0A8E2ANQ4_9APHY|nr:hypothetical protein OBBRIDRAFT_298061 [Obba rivulosa]